MSSTKIPMSWWQNVFLGCLLRLRWEEKELESLIWFFGLSYLGECQGFRKMTQSCSLKLEKGRTWQQVHVLLGLSQLPLIHAHKEVAKGDPGGLCQLGLDLEGLGVLLCLVKLLQGQLRQTELGNHPSFQPSAYPLEDFPGLQKATRVM